MAQQYELMIAVDGVNVQGLSLPKKPSNIVLTLSVTETSCETTVLGSREIIVP